MAGADRAFSFLVSAGSPAFWYTHWNFFLEMPLEKKTLHLELGFRLQNPSNNSICFSTTLSEAEALQKSQMALFVGQAGTELSLKGCASWLQVLPWCCWGSARL